MTLYQANGNSHPDQQNQDDLVKNLNRCDIWLRATDNVIWCKVENNEVYLELLALMKQI